MESTDEESGVVASGQAKTTSTEVDVAAPENKLSVLKRKYNTDLEMRTLIDDCLAFYGQYKEKVEEKERQGKRIILIEEKIKMKQHLEPDKDDISENAKPSIFGKLTFPESPFTVYQRDLLLHKDDPEVQESLYKYIVASEELSESLNKAAGVSHPITSSISGVTVKSLPIIAAEHDHSDDVKYLILRIHHDKLEIANASEDIEVLRKQKADLLLELSKQKTTSSASASVVPAEDDMPMYCIFYNGKDLQTCKKGANCNFVHGKPEHHAMMKRICSSFLATGCCQYQEKYNRRCKFLHVRPGKVAAKSSTSTNEAKLNL